MSLKTVKFEAMDVKKVSKKEITFYKRYSNTWLKTEAPKTEGNEEIINLLLTMASKRYEGGLDIWVQGFKLKAVCYRWVQKPKKLEVKE